MAHLEKKHFPRRYEESLLIEARAEDIFNFLDDYSHLSSHMSESSSMLGGGRMQISVDEGHGQRVGSHIQMSGRAFGIALFLDEVVIHREPPFVKIWETVGNLKLLIIGHYRMGLELEPQSSNSLLRVYIDYELPRRNAWLGRLLGGFYAKWCVKQMIKGACERFSNPTR